MITSKKSNYYLRLFLDLAILNISFVAAAILAQSLPILLERNYMFALMMGMNFVWYFTSNAINFYEDFDTRNFSYQFINILKNVAAQVLTGIVFVFATKENLFNRNFTLYYSLFLIFFVSVRTQALKRILRSIRGSEKNIRNALIIGAGELGKNFYEMINGHHEFGYNFVGFIDNIKESTSNDELIGSIKELDNILPERNIEEVIIALPLNASHQINEIVNVCNRHAVRIHIIPDYFQFLSKKYQITMIGNYPVITVRSEPLAEFHWRFLKRTFDIIFSLTASILILSWLFPLIYILNRFTSPGPLLFLQDRVGANDEIFKCYKFRTMHVNKGNDKEYQPTVENDPRITVIGKFMRKSNIDELPQLLNVLKGDMSIVGPRPHPIAFNEVYKKMVEEIRIRNWVKPGITGWAQVHGYRGDVLDYEENKRRTQKRIEFDLWYIENWSLLLDIQIILTTVWQMIKGDTKGV